MHASPGNLFTRLNARPLRVWACLLVAFTVVPLSALANEPDWSIGVYTGRYHDAEPAGAIVGRANYLDQYILALTASKTVWRSDRWPVSLEIDGMLGQQWGLATLGEVAVAPAVRFSGFPWRDTLRTDLRLAPLGISYTTSVSPLELGADGQGSRTLNYLFVELAVSRPQAPADEFFVRLHHRCAIYDLLNSFGANGEDFLTVGYRVRF
ncbi:hypothetical protein [Rhodoferax saidenbachensis]|uniref:Acyloxyacyl hydrolase n=1 Tax=Rhodoferax saidenbachensis TaxID=1484693 RepID=A0A1P8KD65_9BURK|nr:hypothetical protein [Rhodoferax saidenbachensis]APW43977.1 hypothetical protein RS694_16515 [Rhodoferax saidenbachensis]